MDEQALNDAYSLFTRQGYSGTIDQFKKLISTNKDALNDSYQIFRAQGYNGDINNYSTLVGVKKKTSSTISTPDSEVGMEDLQNGFDFSPTIFEAPAVLTPKKQKEYIEEQKLKPVKAVEPKVEESTIPKGFETYQAPSKEGEQGLGLNILSSLNRSIYKNLIGSPIKGLGTLIEGATSLLPRQIRSETGKGIISESLIDFGNYFNNAIDEISPQDEAFKNSLTDQFAQAFGQVASTIMTAGFGTAASKGLSLASKAPSMLAKPLSARGAALAATKEAGEQIIGPVGISSALTMGQSEYERAKEAGASDEQAFEAFYKNAVTGSVLETIPVMQFMKRFNQGTKGGLVNYIKTKGVAGLTGGVEEMTTEVLQTIYSNKTAQEIYNENQDIFEGIKEAGGIGFGVGFLLNAMGANAKILRKEGKDAEADVLENQIEEIQSRIENGPPAVYKINGLKIESPQIVSDMIERMDAPDLSKLNIEIDNDPVLKTKLQDKIITSSIMAQVREANPELNEPSLKAITELEKQLTLLEGNKTQTGKDKAAAIRTQIKNIQENQLQEEAVTETITAEAPEDAEIGNVEVAELKDVESTVKTMDDFDTFKDAVGYNVRRTADIGVDESEANYGNAKNINEIKSDLEKAGIQVEKVPQSSMSDGNYASFDGDKIKVTDENIPLQVLLHEIGEKVILDLDKAKQKIEHANNIFEAVTTYGASRGNDAFSDNFYLYFLSPKTLKDLSPNVYAELDKIIPDNIKDLGKSLMSKYGVTEQTLKYNKPQTDAIQEQAAGQVPVLTETGVSQEVPEGEPKTEPQVLTEEVVQEEEVKAPEITRESIRSLTDEEINPLYDEIPLRLLPTVEGVSKQDAVFEAYFKSKKKNTNPELVQAVEKVIIPAVSLKTQPVQEVAVAPEVIAPEVVAEEQFVPITVPDIQFDIRFSRDEASDVVEGEREGDNGRTYNYISEVETAVSDADGTEIGYLVKMIDDDKNLTFEARDENGNNLSKNDEGFATLGEARQALLDNINKANKKEFAKEAKAKAKAKEKEVAKAAKAKAKTETKKPTKSVVSETIDDLLDLDVADQDNLDRIFNALDNADKFLDKAFKGGAFELSILAIPIGTIRGTIIIIKALVKGGMLLRDAIKKVAADNNISQESVKDILNMAPIQEEFNSLMEKVDKLIARQKSRGIEDGKITSNIDTFIRKQDEYLNANDAQKKIIEREARAKMGAAPKRAVSIGRVLGALKDITNISRAEKLKIISQIRQLSKDAAKDLAKEIRAMASSGKITPVQAANIVARFAKVNMLNEISVSNFVDYMAKVFANAEYANKIDVAKSKLKNARKNIATKIGISDGLMLPLQKLFSINPSLIPDAYLERYLELVDMFSAKQAVLNLEEKSVVKNDVEAILKEIDIEQSKVDELNDRFSNSKNKVFKDDVLDYAASIKKMIEEGEINQEEADIMRKYKADILPEVESSALSEEQIIEKKKEYLSLLKDSAINGSELPTRDEKNLANRLAKLIRTMTVEDLMKLSITDLKNLLKLIDNINNNYLPHYAQIMVEKLNGIKYGKILAEAIKKAKLLKFSTLYARFKNLFTKKGAVLEAIRRNPLYNIDQLFGDFKTKDVFNALFEKTSEAEASFKSALKSIQNKLEKAEAKVAKSFNLNPDETLISKFKMMTYMIQLEYDSNKGSEQVNPAAAYLNETIKHIDGGKSRFGERDSNMLQEILKDYGKVVGKDKNGKDIIDIDNEKLYNSFNQAEKDAIKDIKEINESLKDTAQYTASIIRGDAIDPLNNYVHLNVLQDGRRGELNAATDFLNQVNDSRTPSTKAKSLISRTKGAKPLNFDVFASAQRGSKFVLLDYHLTEPIRTARRTINEAANILDSTVGLTKTQNDIKNAVENAFNEAVDNLLTNSIVQNSWVDEAIDFISKQGYRAVLAGTGRFAAELTSNTAFALLSNPKSFIEGAKYRAIIMSELGPSVMRNVKSKQSSRIYPSDTLSGSFVDQNIMSKAGGRNGGASNNVVANKMQQIYNLTLKREQNFVGEVADFLISTPDKIVMRPIWFGSFATEFEKISGKKVDFQKIADNDQAYMNANEDAIQNAKRSADEVSVMTGATDNTFMGMLKGRTKPNQSLTTRAFNNFNNYMTNFMVFEFITTRTAIYALVGDSSISKKQGAALLAAAATRMTIYTMLSNALASGIMGLFGFGEDEEEEVKNEKTFMQKLGQSLISTFTSLLIGRDFGNAMKLGINMGIEEFNEEYLDFLREGDYDPYKDKIAYSLIPTDDKNKDELSKFLIKMTGSFAPVLNTGALIYKNAGGIVPVLSGGTTKKEEDAIKREKQTITQRIPLEILGNLGYIPLYKEIRKVSNDNIYKSLRDAENKVETSVKDDKSDEKVSVLRSLKDKTRDKDELKAINEKIIELEASPEQKEVYKEKNKIESDKKKRLLYDSSTGTRYDNETELKKYNPRLYKKNFGLQSEWYKEHKDEKIVTKKMNEAIRKVEDKEYGYSSSKKNSDGTKKRSSLRGGSSLRNK